MPTGKGETTVAKKMEKTMNLQAMEHKKQTKKNIDAILYKAE